VPTGDAGPDALARFSASAEGDNLSDPANRSSSPSQEVTLGIIAFIILGLLAGAIAKAILPGDDPGGIIVTAIIGIVGALLGGFLAGVLFDADPLDEFFDISTWLTAIVGAIVLLIIYRMVVGRGRRATV
jgi:uncharacterized membrane protein YeaQ/YmgE (transglycosylase-associated protein family)